jgi:hypothetical protein
MRVLNILTSTETREQIVERTGLTRKTVDDIFNRKSENRYRPITDVFDEMVSNLSGVNYERPVAPYWEPPRPEPRAYHRGEEIGQIEAFKRIYENRERETTREENRT